MTPIPLVRIVKMHFQEDKIEDFATVFEKVQDKIQNFDGCLHLSLYQEANQPHVIFTYSVWRDEEALNAYRHSPFFQDTWKQTKALFADKPAAWSLQKIAGTFPTFP